MPRRNGDWQGRPDNSEKLPDFTNPDSLKDKSDGQLFCLLKVGKGHMPLETPRNSPNNLWNLVNFVRSLWPESMRPALQESDTDEPSANKNQEKE